LNSSAADDPFAVFEQGDTKEFPIPWRWASSSTAPPSSPAPRRSVADLRPIEIPANYWVNLAPLTSALVGLLGVALTAYLLLG
jgi:hypothetical protein